MSTVLVNGRVWRPPVATLDDVLKAAAGVADTAELDRLIDDVGRTLETETVSRSEATLMVKALERAADRLEGPAAPAGGAETKDRPGSPFVERGPIEFGAAVPGARLG